MYFVDVLLPFSLPKYFTYQVLEDEIHLIKVGIRIAVPFGKSKIYTGLVVKLHQQKPLLYEPKEIHQIIDTNPIVLMQQIQHWEWIASYYMCSVGSVFKAAIPSLFLLESETIIKLKTVISEKQDQSITDDEYLIIEALKSKSQITLAEAQQILNKKNVYPILHKLIDKNKIDTAEKIEEAYKPKKQRFVKLASKYYADNTLANLLEKVKGAPKQKEVVLVYYQLDKEKKGISVQVLSNRFDNAISAIIKSLIDKEILEEFYQEVSRLEASEILDFENINSNNQTLTVNELKNQFNKNEVVLFKGMSIHGRVKHYLPLMQDQINSGKSVLILIPEIGLSYQLVPFLQKILNKKIIVYHSKYSNSERVEVWNAVLNQQDESVIILGTRSALFLPFSNLGLIVVEEEQEYGYKQSEAVPRFHARDTAIILSALHKSKVILGAQTPSLETLFNVNAKKYGIIELIAYENNQPKFTLVNLREAYKKKQMNAFLSFQLIEAITEKLDKKEQVVLFQNRRGYAPVLECMSCGHVPQCVHCNVSLTFHKVKSQLQCHYCGYSAAVPKQCYVCSDTQINTKGLGTEQIEDVVKDLFPQANVFRIDQDTMRKKYAFEAFIESMNNEEIDIVIGTQMISKGIEFTNATLIAVLNADNLLNFPDFRSFEKTFHLLNSLKQKLSKKANGEFFLQAYDVNHTVFNAVLKNNTSGFYAKQIEERKQYKYPPYVRLIRITLKHKNYQLLKEASLWCGLRLKNKLEETESIVLGPEEPVINKIRNQYIRVIMLKVTDKNKLKKVKTDVLKVFSSFETIGIYRSINYFFDVDPY
jgi:primosomal protein N' (replication factor Y) (superfamily II helicase)